MVFWADRVADEIIKRRRYKYIHKDFSADKQVVETGTSISGVPHIGNASDVIRGEAVKRALISRGIKTEFIWVADDMDPFRKVPANLDDSYRKYLGMPVSSLPDPYGCCNGYVEHFVNLFIDSLKDFGVKPVAISGTETYKSGKLYPYIKEAINKRDTLREILNKYREIPLPEDWIPWNAICENCGKIATTVAIDVEGDYVSYICEDTTVGEGKYSVEGCGHKGVSDIRKGEGKLPWKPEWAARWALFNVTCEPFGKEHATLPGGSFWVNGEISEKIFNWPEPYPVIYEFVLGKGGEKMSSSRGNTISTWEWSDYAPPEVLKLFFYKKLQKQREFDLQEIPILVDEYDRLEKLYFGLEREDNEKKLEHLKRLYEMCQIDKPPTKFPVKIPFRFASVISQLVPAEDKFDRVLEILRKTGHATGELSDEDKQRIIERVTQAGNWVKKYGTERDRIEITDTVADEIKNLLTPELKEIITEIAEYLENNDINSDELNTRIFQSAKSHGIKPQKVFTAFYRIFLGKKFGPKLAPFLLTLNRDFVITRLREAVQ